MRDYKILDIPNLKDIQTEILNYIPIERISHDGKHVNADSSIKMVYKPKDILNNSPSLYNYLKGMHIDTEQVGILTNLTQPFTKGGIHSDDIRYMYMSMTIPIQNYENTKLYIYEPKGECKVLTDMDRKNRYLAYDEEQVTLIDEFITDRPYLLNTACLHQFTNDFSKIRYTLLIRIPMSDVRGVQTCLTQLLNIPLNID